MRKIHYTKPVLELIDLMVETSQGESEPPPPAPRRDEDPIWDPGTRQQGEFPWDDWSEE
ncbi:hypothetical protein ACFLQV_03845 [Calditrichota bacterium]